VISRLYSKYSLATVNFVTLCEIMLKDKKNQNGKINCTLLEGIGKYTLDHICTDAELCESLAFYAAL